MPKKKKTKIKKRKKFKKRKTVKRKNIKKRLPKKFKQKNKIKKKNKKVKKTSIKDQQDQELIIKTRPEWVKSSLASKSQYSKKYSESIKHNNEFWKKEGKRINWIKPYKKIKDVKYSKTDVKIKWFEDGTLNASANCID